MHLLTASGAAFALLALHAAHLGDWHTMFAWLGFALVIDAVDGPLARRVGVDSALPRFSGVRLDLIVDYLTYVVVPAFALTEADLLPEAFRLPAALAIMVSSLFHFADRASKTDDGYFVGFPAIWNIVCLYLFALALPPLLALGVVAILILGTFVPVLFVHPFRVALLQALTAIVTLLWAAAAVAAVLYPFPSPLWVQLVLLATASYLIGVGLHRSLLSPSE